MKNYINLFYYMNDLVVEDNLIMFGITTALRSSPESTRIVRNSFARSGRIMT